MRALTASLNSSYILVFCLRIEFEPGESGGVEGQEAGPRVTAVRGLVGRVSQLLIFFKEVIIAILREKGLGQVLQETTFVGPFLRRSIDTATLLC